jgi:preprotein translocase subunit YajC
MLISPAYAQATGPAGGGGFDIVSLLPLILIFVVFYFFLIRPQQKRMKEHRQMVGALRRGDRVVTAGGIVGTVVKVLNETEIQVEIADGVRVKVVKGTVQEVLSKTQPANEGGKDVKDSGGKDTGGKDSGGKDGE